ncbi:hypothetical protein [Pseudoalteromonas luteoviolacea]|uniref:hypothetical protein n=1 Tax=Pseudoalteromonas luteoviolacea TaxID=43657 RepID=UPI001B36EBB1|nr:hypothetical protein [Pseudoalteromonas luteoviolacea]MBQ4836797.1 hypothetical protein [Pseudoalteromonas luteoviolacea]
MNTIKDQIASENQSITQSMVNLIVEQANEAINLVWKRDTSSTRIACEDVLTDLQPMAKLICEHADFDIYAQIKKVLDELHLGAELLHKLEV